MVTVAKSGSKIRVKLHMPQIGDALVQALLNFESTKMYDLMGMPEFKRNKNHVYWTREIVESLLLQQLAIELVERADRPSNTYTFAQACVLVLALAPSNNPALIDLKSKLLQQL